MNERPSSVLIAGAGPTGLVLALWLTKIGIKVRLIDKTDQPGTTSRALAIHARTLEYYRQLGIADAVLEKGFRFPRINLWVNRKNRAQFSIGDMGKGLSPFPYVAIFPQDQHEEFLITQLRKLGVEVERQTELLDFESFEDSVHARLNLPSGAEEVFTAAFLAGCDGARSVVREKMAVGFEGSTYPDLFYVADVSGEGPVLNGELHGSLDEAEFLAIFPMKEKGHARLIGVIRESESKAAIRWEEVNPRIIKDMQINVEKVNWFSTYHVHHRVASHFQAGRVFLLGDAGHIHSPLGGQGMNTGIGDAVNLAWKIGEVIKGRASTHLLKSYEPERIEFAKKLVRTTDQAFQFISSTGLLARFVRTKVVPFVLSTIFRSDFMRRLMYRTLSQTGISYRHCELNTGRAGSLHAGDRLPWVESVDNFAPLRSLEWQVHVYGGPVTESLNLGIPIFEFEWNAETERKGYQRNVVYLVRPDGYIGLIARSGHFSEIRKFLDNL